MKLLLLFLLTVSLAFARGSATGWCQQGNRTVTTSGVASTTKVQQSFPSCTVTVYDASMVLANIYSDNSGTVLANPFVAQTNGQWTFYADTANYSVQLSGAGIPAPFSIQVTVAQNTAGGTGTVTSVATTSPITGGTITTTGTIACATCVTSAAALTSNRLILGGGGQALAVLGSLGTTTTLLHGNAAGAPTFGAVALGTDTSGTLAIGSGGTGQTTQTTAFNALSPQTTRGDLITRDATNDIRLALGTSGQCLKSDGTDTVWGTCIPAVPLTVPNGGTGATSLTGAVIGTGATAMTAVAASSQLQDLRRKANQTSTTYEFATPPYLVNTDFDFPSQAPGGSLTMSITNTVTLTPCPVGVAGADTAHYVYISAGTGAAEAVLITGGTCTSGATTGTITFVPANNHTGAWTVTSATSGIQEAMCASSVSQPEVTIRGASTLNANVSYCGKTTADFLVSAGATFTGTGVLPNTTSATAYNFDARTNSLIFAQTQSVTVANTTSELTLVGTGVGSATLPANFFRPGTSIKITMAGFHSSTASPNITIKIKLGGATIMTTGAVASSNGTNDVMLIEGYITCRTVGAMGTIFAQGHYQEIHSMGANDDLPNTTTNTIDTTSALAVDITAQWGTMAAGNTMTATNFTISKL